MSWAVEVEVEVEVGGGGGQRRSNRASGEGGREGVRRGVGREGGHEKAMGKPCESVPVPVPVQDVRVVCACVRVCAWCVDRRSQIRVEWSGRAGDVQEPAAAACRAQDHNNNSRPSPSDTSASLPAGAAGGWPGRATRQTRPVLQQRQSRVRARGAVDD